MIELKWKEVEEGERGFQLAPPYGREYDLFYRMAAIKLSDTKSINPGPWLLVPIPEETK